MSRSTRLVVLESFPTPRSTTNPYLVQLMRSMPGEVQVLTFGWREALLGTYDVLHLHWPEYLVRGASPLRTAVRRLLVVILLVRIAVLRTAVVRTLHNASPHEAGGRTEAALLSWFDRVTTVWIRLNSGTTAPSRAPMVTILLGHYRDWFAELSPPSVEPGRIAFVGLLRPYKGVEDLLDAFRALPQPELRLRVVGRPTQEGLRDRVLAAAETDPRIGVLLEYVDDATLVDEVGRAELIVLPYHRLQNSSAALLALSLGRPVLLPHGPTASELAAEVGEGWLSTFEGPLTGEDLLRALEETRGARHAPAPDLSAREWDAAGQAHAAAFRAAVAARRGD